MSSSLIRPAVQADAGRLLEIYEWYVKNTAVTFEYDTPSLDEFRARMARTAAKYPYLVIEDGGVLLGYAYAGPFVGRAAYDWSCEMTVYLDHDARRRGFGRALYDAIQERLARMGVRNLYACIGEPPAEEDPYLTHDSARFHARMGFREVGRFHLCGCKFGRWYDMIWMEKLIGGHDGPPTALKKNSE